MTRFASIPSYANGFARSAAESDNPGLWRGLAGIWLPSLGPTGVTLHDLAGRAHNAALINMDPATDWVVTERGWIINAAPALPVESIVTPWSHGGTTALTFLAYVRYAAQSSLAGTVNGSWNDQGWSFYYRNGGGTADHSFAVTTASGNAYARTGAKDTNWHLVGGQYANGQVRVILDTKIVAGTSTSGVIPVNQPFALLKTFGTGHGAEFAGDILFEGVWDRVLTPAEIQHLYADPHAMVRQRRKVFKAAAAGAIYDETASGTLTFSGASLPSLVLPETTTGSTTLSSQASVATTFNPTPSGSILLAGDVAPSAILSNTGSGSVVMGGEAAASITLEVSASGPVQIFGSALGALLVTEAAAGGLVLAGQGSPAVTAIPLASGAVVVAGASEAIQSHAETASGPVSLSGSTTHSQTITVTALGGVAVDGQATLATILTEHPAGPITIGGDGSVSVTYTLPAIGEIILAGTGLDQYVPAVPGGLSCNITVRPALSARMSSRRVLRCQITARPVLGAHIQALAP